MQTTCRQRADNVRTTCGQRADIRQTTCGQRAALSPSMRCLQGTASSKKLSTIVELATAQIVDRSDTAGASASPAARTKLRCLNRAMVFSARASDYHSLFQQHLLRYVCCNMLPPCCECCNTLQHDATLFGLCCNMLPSASRMLSPYTVQRTAACFRSSGRRAHCVCARPTPRRRPRGWRSSPSRSNR